MSDAYGQGSLLCFGNEPSWSVDLTKRDAAKLSMLGESPTTYRGRDTRLEFLREAVWRGTAAGRDLVLFMRETTCSDGMSDVVHPVAVRASLPDGRFLAGCCRVPGGATEQSALEGVTWQLTALPGYAADRLAASRTPVTVRFEGGRVSGFSGCNRFTGDYVTKEGQLTIGKLAGTMMACDAPATALETAFRDAFAGTLSPTVEGPRLALTTASGAVLSFEQDPARLEGPTWLVTGYNNGRMAVVSPVKDSKITLTFKEGTVTGSTGCNTFRAGYSVKGNQIAIKPAATTRMACSSELMTQERELLAALESATTVKVEGGTLDMHRADGERVIHATAER
jgi:heat shock protein HslJ